MGSSPEIRFLAMEEDLKANIINLLFILLLEQYYGHKHMLIKIWDSSFFFWIEIISLNSNKGYDNRLSYLETLRMRINQEIDS